jgi:hypothetical protein
MWQIFLCLLALSAAVPVPDNDDHFDDHFESAEITTFVKAVPVVGTFPAATQYKTPVDTSAAGTASQYTVDTTGTNYGAAQPAYRTVETPADVEVTHVDRGTTGVQPTNVQKTGTQFFVKVDDDDDDFKVAFTPGAFAPGQFRTEGVKTPFFYKKFSAEVDDDDYYKYKYAPTFRVAGVAKAPTFYKRSVEFDDDFVVAPSAQFRTGAANTPVFFKKFSAEVDDDDYFRTVQAVPIPYTAGNFRTAGSVAVPITYSVGNYRFKYDDDDDKKFFFRTAGTAAVPTTYSAGYRFKYDDDDHDDVFDHDDDK